MRPWPRLLRTAAMVLAAVAALTPQRVAAELVKLSGGAVFGTVRDFRFSPDGRDVVYQLWTTNQKDELWQVPTAGGTRRRLTFVFADEITQFAISDDGLWVVYLAVDTLAGPAKRLWSVPLKGGPTTELNAPLAAGETVISFHLSPDSRRVVYKKSEGTVVMGELYSAPIEGGPETTLHQGPLSFGIKISPDAAHVVYQGQEEEDDDIELYGVPLAGGPPVKLNGPLSGPIHEFWISPDSSRVVYHANQDSAVPELYSVPIAGGPDTKLNEPLLPGFFVLPGPRISADGSRVVYIESDTLERFDLLSVPIGGGAVVELETQLQTTGVLSPDSSRIVYRLGDQLYSIPLGGGMRVELPTPSLPGLELQTYLISPDSRWVVYEVEGFLGIVTGYRVPITGGTAEVIWSDRRSITFEIDPASRSVLLLGTSGGVINDGVQRLWLTPLAATATPHSTELVPTSEFATGGNVVTMAFGPRGDILFRGDLEVDGVWELYSVPRIFADGFESGDTSAWDVN